MKSDLESLYNHKKMDKEELKTKAIIIEISGRQLRNASRRAYDAKLPKLAQIIVFYSNLLRKNLYII